MDKNLEIRLLAWAGSYIISERWHDAIRTYRRIERETNNKSLLQLIPEWIAYCEDRVK